MQKYVFLFRVYPPSLSSLWLCEHTGFRKIHTKPLPLCKRRNGWDFDLVYICLCWWCGLRTQRAHRTRTILNVCGLKWKLNKKNSKQYALLLVHIVEGVRGTKRYYAKRSTSNGEVSDLKREHFLISILSWCCVCSSKVRFAVFSLVTGHQHKPAHTYRLHSQMSHLVPSSYDVMGVLWAHINFPLLCSIVLGVCGVSCIHMAICMMEGIF